MSRKRSVANASNTRLLKRAKPSGIAAFFRPVAKLSNKIVLDSTTSVSPLDINPPCSPVAINVDEELNITDPETNTPNISELQPDPEQDSSLAGFHLPSQKILESAEFLSESLPPDIASSVDNEEPALLDTKPTNSAINHEIGERNHPEVSKLPIKKTNRQIYRFRAAWYNDYPWITWDASVGGVLCEICYSANKLGIMNLAKNSEPTFIKSGFLIGAKGKSGLRNIRLLQAICTQ